MTEIQIDESIFNQYPSFRRGIVVASNLNNHGTSPELEAMLNHAVTAASEQSTDLNTEPRITTWNDAHRQFGSNPNKFLPAHRALLKRVQKKGTKLPLINKVVAIMNYNSITDVVPVGGDDIKRTGKQLKLCKAKGDETFIPLGCPEVVEHPESGEIIYVVADSGEIMCRRWNWRNSHQTGIYEDTTTIVINVDGLGENSDTKTLITRDRVAKMLEQFCQADVSVTLLSPSQPSYRFAI